MRQEIRANQARDMSPSRPLSRSCGPHWLMTSAELSSVVLATRNRTCRTRAREGTSYTATTVLRSENYAVCMHILAMQTHFAPGKSTLRPCKKTDMQKGTCSQRSVWPIASWSANTWATPPGTPLPTPLFRKYFGRHLLSRSGRVKLQE